MLIVSIIIWKRIVHRNNKMTTEKCIYIDKCFYINFEEIVFYAVVMFALRVIHGCLSGYNAGVKSTVFQMEFCGD